MPKESTGWEADFKKLGQDISKIGPEKSAFVDAPFYDAKQYIQLLANIETLEADLKKQKDLLPTSNLSRQELKTKVQLESYERFLNNLTKEIKAPPEENQDDNKFLREMKKKPRIPTATTPLPTTDTKLKTSGKLGQLKNAILLNFFKKISNLHTPSLLSIIGKNFISKKENYIPAETPQTFKLATNKEATIRWENNKDQSLTLELKDFSRPDAYQKVINECFTDLIKNNVDFTTTVNSSNFTDLTMMDNAVSALQKQYQKNKTLETKDGMVNPTTDKMLTHLNDLSKQIQQARLAPKSQTATDAPAPISHITATPKSH